MATTRKTIPKKGTPKHDGSGQGKRANQGQQGCPPSKQPKKGKGK